MATLNVTPDSFSDAHEYETISAASEYAQKAVEAGAQIIDVGWLFD
jgi:dihydropteroate synthase